jgi:hypothetical protein
MATYDVVFHEGHWRIGYDGLHIGEYATADLAAEAALRIARSRFAPSPRTQINKGPDGAITIGDAEERA